MNNIILVGGGSFALQIIDWLAWFQLPEHAVVLGYLATPNESSASRQLGIPCLGDAISYRPNESDLFVCALLDPDEKLRICRALQVRGGRFKTLMQPHSGLMRRTTIGEGCVIAPKTELTSDITVGDFVTIQSFTGIGHDVRVGTATTIGSHCALTGYVSIGEGVIIQPQVVTLPKVSIGNRCRIGAGSVVARNVPPGISVWGVPARKVGSLIEAV